ncbi:MAG: hypothetical protein IRZ11_08535 [Clostridia bacterium]|nr:hypothetical protein [Clostridia bacterium]
MRRGRTDGRGRRWAARPAVRVLVALALAFLPACGVLPSPQPFASGEAPSEAGASDRAEQQSAEPFLLDGPHARDFALSAISRARERVDLELYELGDPELVAAVVGAEGRGVAVRVILDATEDYSRKSLGELEAAGVPVKAFRVPGGIDHVKLLVADGAVLFGGVNWGPRSWENHDFDLAWPGAPGTPPPPAELLGHVGRDWSADRPTDREDGPVVYADGHIAQAVLAAVAGAEKAIAILAADLSDRDTLQALAAAAARGVRVTAVVSSQEKATREAARWLGDRGVPIRYYRGPATLHAKVLVVDERVVVLGSANFSYHAYHANHELAVRLIAPGLARALADDARRLWRTGREP